MAENGMIPGHDTALPHREKVVTQMSTCNRERILCIVSTITLMISIVVVTLSAWMMSDRLGHGEVSENTAPIFETCVRCDLLKERTSVHNPLYKVLTKKEEDGVSMCCASDSPQISALTELVAWSEEPEEQLPRFNAGSFSLSSASAHKRLVPANWSGHDYPTFPEENVALGHELGIDVLREHVRNVILDTSGMYIEIPGFYCVYSEISFKPDSAKPCKDLAKQTWDHTVILTRNATQNESRQTLLTTTHTCCDTCVRNRATSFATGTFLLQKYDQLHAEVSGNGIVSFRCEGSFLGLSKLGPAGAGDP